MISDAVKFVVAVAISSLLLSACGKPKSSTHESSNGVTEVVVDNVKHREGPITVQIHRALIGDKIVESGKCYDWQLAKERKAGNQLIYFDVSVNNDSDTDQFVGLLDFTMQDAENVSYAYFQVQDSFSVSALPRASVRGGVAFSIPKGVYPRTLSYKTGYVRTSTGEKIYCQVDLASIINRTGNVQ